MIATVRRIPPSGELSHCFPDFQELLLEFGRLCEVGGGEPAPQVTLAEAEHQLARSCLVDRLCGRHSVQLRHGRAGLLSEEGLTEGSVLLVVEARAWSCTVIPSLSFA